MRDPVLEKLREANRALSEALRDSRTGQKEEPVDVEGFPSALAEHKSWGWLRQKEAALGNGAVLGVHLWHSYMEPGRYIYQLKYGSGWCETPGPMDLPRARALILRSGVLLSEGRWWRRSGDDIGDAPAPRGIVYFARAVGGHGPIKIGWTTRGALERINEISPRYPYRLEAVGLIEGPALLEGRMHRKFAHLRLNGEWFNAGPDLLQFIEGQCRAARDEQTTEEP